MSSQTSPLMSIDTPKIRTHEALDLYDLGWIILCIGLAIGSGIIFLPIQVGLKGIWVFAVSLIFAYPAVYLLQSLYLKTLSASPECKSYAAVVSDYLGKNWGAVMGAMYFLMLLKGMLSYSLIVTFDSASYLQSYGITEGLLSDRSWYALAILAFLVAIASQGERLLFRVSGPMVVMKLLIVLGLAFLMIPFWNIDHWGSLPALGPLLRDSFLTLPFTLFSILFVQILSPLNVAYRNRYSDQKLATRKALRVNRIAYFILVISVLFFACSFSLTVSHEQALIAYEKNISVLALSAQVIPGKTIHLMGTALNVFAIFTGFFGLFLGFRDAAKGIVLNMAERLMQITPRRARYLDFFTTVGLLLLLWAWVQLRVSLLLLTEISGPIYAIVACWIPCFLVWKVKKLNHLKGVSLFVVFFFGLLLFVSPFMKFFE